MLLAFNAINIAIFVVKYGFKLYEIGDKRLTKARERTEELFELMHNSSRVSDDPLNPILH